MITKEEVEEYIGRKLFQFEVSLMSPKVVAGRIDFTNKEGNPDACCFSFMVDDWKTLALNCIKYRVLDYLKERELG